MRFLGELIILLERYLRHFALRQQALICPANNDITENHQARLDRPTPVLLPALFCFAIEGAEVITMILLDFLPTFIQT